MNAPAPSPVAPSAPRRARPGPISINLRAGKAVEYLLARGTLPILYWLKKDILAVPVEREGRNLEKYAERIRILESQSSNGSWAGRQASVAASCEQESRLFETIRNAFKLYDFGCGPEHDPIRRAADFIFSTQSREGCFQGPDGPEPSLIAQALALELLCRFGWGAEPRVDKGFRWLFKKQQKDGGWALGEGQGNGRASVRRDRPSPPSSYRVTGIVLGALAESPLWSKRPNTRRAGECLLFRFFADGSLASGRTATCWQELSYPFWATSLLSSLDSLSRIGFKPDRDKIKQALDWLMRRQSSAGYWESRQYKATLEDHLWVTLSVLRMLKRFEVMTG